MQLFKDVLSPSFAVQSEQAVIFFLSWMWVFVAYEYFEQAYIEQQRQDDEHVNFFIRGLLASSYNTISHIQANKKCVLQIIANKYAV